MDYAKEHFGLSTKGADVLWKFMNVFQDLVTGSGKDSKGQTLDFLIEQMSTVKSEMESLAPKCNKEEFADMLLTIDLRLDYLNFRAIEVEFNSCDFVRTDVPQLYARLMDHITTSEAIGRRFMASCDGYLKACQAEAIDAERMERKYYLKSVLENMIN